MHAVKHLHKRVLIFSPEMKVQQCFLRCIAHLCDLPYAEFKDAQMQDAERSRLFAAADTYGRMPKMTMRRTSTISSIASLGSATPTQPRHRAEHRPRHHVDGGADRAVQARHHRLRFLLPQRAPGQKRNDTDWKAISSLSREIKDLVMEYTSSASAPTSSTARQRKRRRPLEPGACRCHRRRCRRHLPCRHRQDGRRGRQRALRLGSSRRQVRWCHDQEQACYDYSEIGVITSKKQVLSLMQQEEAAAARDEKLTSAQGR